MKCFRKEQNDDRFFYIRCEDGFMKISKWKFENEIDTLIVAAKSASNKETARSFLQQAYNKVDGYSNIPYELQQKYREKIAFAEQELGV